MEEKTAFIEIGMCWVRIKRVTAQTGFKDLRLDLYMPGGECDTGIYPPQEVTIFGRDKLMELEDFINKCRRDL